MDTLEPASTMSAAAATAAAAAAAGGVASVATVVAAAEVGINYSSSSRHVKSVRKTWWHFYVSGQ